MSLPSINNLETPILQELNAVGGADNVRFLYLRLIQYFPSLSDAEITEIKNGKAQIIKRKKSGIYVDCSGNIIDIKLYSNTWYVHKCLVASDYKYID